MSPSSRDAGAHSSRSSPEASRLNKSSCSPPARLRIASARNTFPVHIRIGIRWWLGTAFALIAAITAAAVALVFSQRSAAEFRERAEDVAAGRALSAAIAVATTDDERALAPQVTAIAGRHSVALFVFDDRGRLLTPARSRGVAFGRISDGEQALGEALRERRFVSTNEEVGATVIGIPVYGGNRRALVAYASHPDLAAGLGIVRRNVVEAMLWA